MDTTYPKGGSAGSKGIDFQVSLLTIFMLNALRSLTKWKLSTENKMAGKFDDVVLELSDGSAVFLQAKHRENGSKKILLSKLLSVNSKNDDFSIPKYFFSYLDIKKNFSTRSVIICTNASPDKTALQFMTNQKISHDSILYGESDDCSLYTFTDDILPYLKESLHVYHKNNCSNKDVDDTSIDEDMAEFLEKLQIYFNYPSETSIERTIDHLLSFLRHDNDLYKEVYSQDIRNKVKYWFQQTRGEYLTEIRAELMFCEIKSEKFCDKLGDYSIHLDFSDNTFTNSKRFFHVALKAGHLLPLLKIRHFFKSSGTKVLYINPDDSSGMQLKVVEAFRLPQYTFLVIVLPKFQDSEILTEILKIYSYKKVILLDVPTSEFARQIEFKSENRSDLFGFMTLEDIPEEDQMALLEKTCICFQEYMISPKELLAPKVEKNLTLEILEKLVKSQPIEVGGPVSDLDEDICRCYIERTLRRENDKTEVEIFPEKDIGDINEKIILISDIAGMGKSTFLNKMAFQIKKQNPQLWVIRLELQSYTRFLRTLIRKKSKVMNIIQLLNSREETKLNDSFEKLLFSIEGKIVLMLDGIDEVSPDYTQLVLGMLKECQQASNFAKIFITTRPHIAEELERVLQIKSFTLHQLSQDSQLSFLTSYWAHNMELDYIQEKKCERYAAAVIKKMWVNVDDEAVNSFTAVPLQLRMIAEIFHDQTSWEGCKQYIASDEAEPKLPGRMDITELYDMFIDKKRDIFLDKENPDGSILLDKALLNIFENCLIYYQSTALKEMLNDEDCEAFSCFRQGTDDLESEALKIGLVQKTHHNIKFVHRTFAEYFLAKSILSELQTGQRDVEFQKLFVDGILSCPEFKTTRAFLDSFLRNLAETLPCTVLDNYKSLQHKTKTNLMCTSNLIHTLTQEGCVSLLQLVLNCVEFKIVRDKEVYIKELYSMTCASSNTLHSIKWLISKGGLNIKDDISWTPIHYAVRGQHKDLVQFLVTQGANVNSRDDENRTPLHIAGSSTPFHLKGGTPAKSGEGSGWAQHDDVFAKVKEGLTVQITKYLVGQGADVKGKDRGGRTPIYLAIQARNKSLTKYLLDLVSEDDSLDLKETILLYLATDNSGMNIFHDHLRMRQLDAIRYLTQYKKSNLPQIHLLRAKETKAQAVGRIKRALLKKKST